MTQTQLVRRVLKPVLFLACLLPFAWLVLGAFTDGLGANPVETITNTTGIWTLRLIAISLAITPLRWLTKWNPLIQLRRMLGLFAFFYGTLHFMTYFVLDQSLMFDGLWEDIVKRPYITVGFTAFVLLIPLALTSTQGWIRRLGGRRWNLLHRLVYVSAVLGVLHYWWKVKLDVSDPFFYAVIVAVLLGVRLLRTLQHRQPAPISRKTPVTEV
jgi:methionine sulfoxide reductase heme-binding subunit